MYHCLGNYVSQTYLSLVSSYCSQTGDTLSVIVRRTKNIVHEWAQRPDKKQLLQKMSCSLRYKLSSEVVNIF